MRAHGPILAFVAFASACPAHVAFAPPPDASAPREARAHFYAQHTLAPAAREDLAVRTRLFEDRPSVTRRAGTLGSGVRVVHVEDLRPLVPAASPTAQSIDETVALDTRADWLLGGGLGVGGAGLLGAVALLAIDLGVTPEVSSRPTVDLSPFFFGAAASFVVGVAGGGALATWGVATRDDADRARTRAFASYDADLKRALALDAPAPAPPARTPDTPPPPAPPSSTDAPPVPAVGAPASTDAPPAAPPTADAPPAVPSEGPPATPR